MSGQKRWLDSGELPKHYDAGRCEKKWNRYWQEYGVFRYDTNASQKDTFYIDTPPPTVSGSLHLGHVFSYTHNDIIARYMRMNGKNIFYPIGWDDNGLPTERRVQNYYHVKCNPEKAHIPGYTPAPATAKSLKGRPETISRKTFIELCGRLTEIDEIAFKKLWMKNGLSCDWNLEYATIDRNSIRQAQLSFLDLIAKGHIEQRFAPTIWDVEFETSVAQAELEEHEKQVIFYYIRFRLGSGENRFKIATTRPELLPACVGITAHPSDTRYRDLFGKHALTPLFSVPVPIFPSKEADPEKGTGIVMVCTFGDTNDIGWWRRKRLPLRQILNSGGRLKDVDFGDTGWESEDPETANRYFSALAGKTVFSAREEIIKLLSKPDYSDPDKVVPLEKMGQPQPHKVKYYEKGKKPVEYLATRQWFVRLLDKKEALIDAGHSIAWHPGYMRERYTSWCENLAYDWCISRQRYFGVPFPVWYKIDEQGKADYASPLMPGKEELPMDPSTDTPKSHLECMRGRPNGFVAETDVFDTWFTSSLTPQIAASFDCDRGTDILPMALRPQSHEIIRTWAFYTIVKAMLHHNRIPWKHVMISGWVLDPDRKKMSKSGGNVVTPDSYFKDFTADGVRYWTAKARLGRDTVIDEKVMKTGRRLVIKIYNAAKFVYGYPVEPAAITQAIDIAFMLELKKAVREITDDYGHYRFSEGLKKTEDFFYRRFTDAYIELAKGRFRSSGENTTARSSAAGTLKKALNILLRLFAPVMPFITEEVWSWSFGTESDIASIHIAPWPTDRDFADMQAPRYTDCFDVACDVMSQINRLRSEKRLPYNGILEAIEIDARAYDRLDKNLTEIKSACRVLEIYRKQPSRK